MAKLKDPFKNVWKREYNEGKYAYNTTVIAAMVIIVMLFITLICLS